MVDQQKIGDADRVNATNARMNAQFAERRYEYLISRRDQAHDRLRAGSLALNASSLVAMLALLGSEGKSAAWVGFTQGNSPIAACAFALGTALAGISLILAHQRYVQEAADSYVATSNARWLSATYEAPLNERGWEKNQEALEEYNKAPLVDFQYSTASIWAQSFSGSCWLFGIVVPLGHTVGFW